MNCLYWLGNTKTPLKDGDTASKIEVDRTYITPKLGDVVEYHVSTFVWTGDKWESLGFINDLESEVESETEDNINTEKHNKVKNDSSDFTEEKVWEKCGTYYEFEDV